MPIIGGLYIGGLYSEWHIFRILRYIFSSQSGGANIEGEEESWDFGTGAGFYVDATEEKWKNNYRMYSYVTKELPAIVHKHFPVNGKAAITGHRYEYNLS